MPSAALEAWTTQALSRLAELEDVHSKLTGDKPGRRWGTTQLNLSFFTALTAQFQAFCRSPHDEAVEVHVAAANGRQANLLRLLLTQGRQIDRGNARTDSLGSDFNRLGFEFIPELKNQGALTVRRLQMLDTLVDIRNDISHGHEAQAAISASKAGITLTKNAYLRYRRALNALAQTMDNVLSQQLATQLGMGPPW